ncbi:vacuolar protein sorting-associated protein 18 homolog [Cloeon dipterum]|uniref:vacuolar protein sorting-associated protein 18 homolog n=1 Tax=Cloeon dipterum TaxID=197152 RepID=UPI0032206AF8
MSSLLAQYEQEAQQIQRSGMGTTGFINILMEEEPAMFSKLRVNIPSRAPVQRLVASNDIALIALTDNTIYRINQKYPDKFEELDLGKPMTVPMRIVGIFLDPWGQHALVSVASKHGDAQPELLFLSGKSTKFRLSSRARGCEITAVGWNHINNTPATTGPILAGSSKGLLFECEFLAETDRMFLMSWEKCWKEAYDIGKGSIMPILGLEFHKALAVSDRYYVLAITANRIYQFAGSTSGPDDKPILLQIFNSNLNSSIPEQYLEISPPLKNSRLQFYFNQIKEAPKTYGWLNSKGLFHSDVDSTSLPGQNRFAACKVVKFGSADGVAPDLPTSFTLTQFHAVFLYPDRIEAVCLLNEEKIFEDQFQTELSGKLLGISKDSLKGYIWVYSEKSVFKYKVTQENRNMWKVFLDAGDFERALDFSKDNVKHMETVLVRKAETLFQKEKYLESAHAFAETQSSFEEIALKFLQKWEIEALKTFLRLKLEKIKPQDKTQITMLCIWVIELFMNQLGELRDSGKSDSAEYALLQNHFDSFMSHRLVQECARNNCDTIYDLMASHGDKDNLDKFTLLNKDYERVIAQNIQKNCFDEALNVLREHGRKDSFYQFAPALMQAIPKRMVQALIGQGRSLSPAKLIPALVLCDKGSSDLQAWETIRYLKHCVEDLQCKDQAIHNYLLALYARLDPGKLMDYLSRQGTEISLVNYDPHYALRICQEREIKEACVQLSCLLGLWESAVDLALLVNLELAKQTASQTPDDNELRKRLWLKIARHVVEETKDVKQAMAFMEQCELIKIEDILPFFSDFEKIDHFKESICKSLQEYNQHIQELKEEMEEATKSAEVIREEINAFKNKSAFVSGYDTCHLCDQQLMSRAFFLFPCSHRFHMDCLQTQVIPMLSSKQLARLKELQLKLASMTVKEDAASIGSSAISTREQVRSEVDSLVAGECIYCGENMIRSIDRPFIDEADHDDIMKDWE